MKLPSGLSDTLKHYVYLYRDPRDGRVFYVGEGVKNRLYAHLKKCTGPLYEEIEALRRAGEEPRIDILRYGMTKSEALLVEATAIDLLGKGALANQVAGHHSTQYGLLTNRDLERLARARRVRVTHPTLLFNLNKRYSSSMTALELYESTRGVWRVGPRRNKAEFAMAVFQGMVLEVYRIHSWHRAGTTQYETREVRHNEDSVRWEFVGEVATDVRDQYVDGLVGWRGQNPVRYENV